MDEPGWTWPAWKFGMKRDALFGKLHDQYNTITSTIQDPEAFHHDVYEISSLASSCDEFHRLLADRKEQRIAELNKSLESASCEIIANPSLIGTEQWQLAIQLFRTKSLDSLVRYFASYLPESHPWHSSDSEASTQDPNENYYYGDDEYRPFLDGGDFDDIVEEPTDLSSTPSNIPASHLPPSPRSMTMCSDDSTAVSSSVDEDYAAISSKTMRSMSFSGSESDVLALSAANTLSSSLENHHLDEDFSQPDDDSIDTPITSVSDLSEVRSMPDEHHDSKHELDIEEVEEPVTPATLYDEDYSQYGDEGEEEVHFVKDGAAVSEVDDMDDKTPTPRTKTSESDSYMSAKAPVGIRQHTQPLYTHVLQEYHKDAHLRRRGNNGRREGHHHHVARRPSPDIGRVAKPPQAGQKVSRRSPGCVVHMS